MDKKPNFSNFVRAFGGRWFTAMSGPLSVPLAIAAVFVPNDIAKLLFALTAIACAIFASYWVWRRERQQVIVSEQQLAPKVALHFEEAEPFVYTMRLTNQSYRCYRFRVVNESAQPLLSCKAQLKSATKDSGENEVLVPFSLRRSQSGNEVFPLRPGEEKLVDLLAVPLASTFPAKIAAVDETWPEFDTHSSAIEKAPSLLVVQVLSESLAVTMDLRFEEVDGEWRVRPVKGRTGRSRAG